MAAPAMTENRAAPTAPMFEFILRGAIAALEVVAALVLDAVPVLVPVIEAVPVV